MRLTLPYQNIPLGDHVRGAVKYVVREVIDPYLYEFRFLLTVQHPEQGPKGSLQRLLAALLLAATDGAAQLLHPGEMKDGDRFRSFVKTYFPWEEDKPDGLSVDEACEFLWEEVRCAMLHRFGMRTRPLLATKLGRCFVLDDARVTAIEASLTERPYSETSVCRNAERTVLWIEPFYWALRIAIPRSISTKEKADAVCAWIESGDWDRTRKRGKQTALAAPKRSRYNL
jgi:hypothetical protein